MYEPYENSDMFHTHMNIFQLLCTCLKLLSNLHLYLYIQIMFKLMLSCLLFKQISS